MTEETVQRVTKDELDRYIGDAVEKAIGKMSGAMNERLDGLRRDLLGDEKAERVAESRDKAAADFDALDAVGKSGVMRKFKAALFDTKAGGVANLESLPFVGDKSTEIGAEQIGTGRLFTRIAPLIIRAKGDWSLAAEYAEKAGNLEIASYIRKTLQAGDFDAGGSMVPELYAADFIGYLYAQSVVRRSGARTIDLSERGNLTIGRLNGVATAYWVGENDEITKSQETTGQLRLDLKKLGVFVPMSEDLIRFAAGDFVEMVRDDMTMIAALKEDLAFLRGDGSANQPKGIRHWAASGNVFATAGTTYANTITDLVKAQYKVEVANVPTPDPVWYLNPRALRGLTLMTDASGDMRPWFIEYSMNGTIEGSRPFLTTQIPKNLDTNKTELYYVEPSQLIIGEGMSLELEESNAATYTDGTARNAFQRFERVIRLGHQVDFAMRHTEAAAIVTGSALGASLDA